jgi:iron uptake system EfeUOB component EfeO/EfeM
MTTSRSLPPSTPHRRLARAVPALAVLAVLGTACAGTQSARPTATSAPTSGPEAGVTSRYGTDSGTPSAPTTVAAIAATHAFTAQVQTAAAGFVSSVTALAGDVGRGDVVAARADELAAQGDYDALRVLETGNTINASALDELASDVPPGQSFGGLHAVERDLWSGGPTGVDVADLEAQAPVAQFLLSRERLGPEAIGSTAVDQLDWVADTALPVSQEQVSHLGLVDVAATVASARQAFGDLAPLARLVDPQLTATVAGQFAALGADCAALGAPTTTTDDSVSPAARLTAFHQLDATASELARLTAELTPYGTAGAPS